MSLDNLPVGWLNVKISDVTLKGEQRKPSDSEKFIYVDIGSINRDLKKIENPQFLLGKDAPSRARKVIKKGDVLVSLTRPNLNAVALIGDNYDQQIASTGFEVISPLQVESKYLFNLVRTQDFINEISKQEQGALYPAAKSSDVQAYEFPLPPLAEQQEIVRQLDIMLAQVEQIKARLDAIPAILKKFRQSVLADAVSGKLTAADVSNWTEVTINDLVNIVNGKSFPSSDYSAQGIKLLRPGNLHVSGKVKWTDKNTIYLPEDWKEKRPELLLKEGSLLMNLTAQSLADEFLGRVCILETADEDILLNQRISSFESKLNYDVKPYLFYVLRSPQFRSYVDTLDTGTLIKHLNIKDIKTYKLKLPPISEQMQIVTLLKSFMQSASRTEELVLLAKKRVNLLTQSILAKAFSSELTAEWREQHQELITGVNSAENLLAKIQAEREANKPVKKTRAEKEV